MALKNLSIKEIKYKMSTKGVSREELEEFIQENEEELEEYEINSAYKILLKKTGQEIEEIEQYLLKKGFKRENIKQAIEKLDLEV